MKYKVVKSKERYFEYCNILEGLATGEFRSLDTEDEIELLTLLIEDWDERRNHFQAVSSIELLRYLMAEHGIGTKELADIAGVGNRLILETLARKRSLPSGLIKILSKHFKLFPEAFCLNLINH
jgi:HTH-type transcriptional regulator/antitoxin HigA